MAVSGALVQDGPGGREVSPKESLDQKLRGHLDRLFAQQLLVFDGDFGLDPSAASALQTIYQNFLHK
jgi:hypothetical protein